MFETKLTEQTQVLSRRAQNVDENLARAIRQLCEESGEVAKCYLLDMQWPGSAEMNFAIALTVDDEAKQMEPAAARFLARVREHSASLADKTQLISANGQMFERYRGHEFYVRGGAPVSTEEPAVIPPADLNQAVENPDLVAALREFEAKRTEQAQEGLFRQLVCANYLVPFFPDEMRTSPGSKPGQVKIEKDSVLKIPACEDRDGKNHLPLFTDWAALRLWLDQPVATLVMPAADAWSFVLSKAHYAGVIVNPADFRFQLGRELIQHLQGAA